MLFLELNLRQRGVRHPRERQRSSRVLGDLRLRQQRRRDLPLRRRGRVLRGRLLGGETPRGGDARDDQNDQPQRSLQRVHVCSLRAKCPPPIATSRIGTATSVIAAASASP